MKTLLITTSTFPRWKNDVVPTFVYDLSRRLTKYFNVIVLAPHSKGAKLFEEKNGMKVYRYKYFPERWEKVAEGAILPNLKKNSLLYIQLICLVIFQFFAMLKIIKKEKVNKIQSHWILPQGFVAALVKKVLNIPYHTVSHGADIFGTNNLFLNFLKKITLNNCSGVAAVSNEIKKEIKKLCPECTVDVIPMGTDIKKFSPLKYDKNIKKKYNIKGPLLLFVGRISEKKGLRYLIEAMPSILKRFPKTKLLVIGSGEEQENMRDLVKKLNLDKEVLFLGAIDHQKLPPYYATADIFIGPSVQAKIGDMEGFGLVFTEAMSCGTITICTDLPAIRDIIKDKRTGFVVKQKNSKDISKKVIEILKDKKKSKSIANKGRTFVTKKFGWDTIAKKYFKHLS